MQMLITVTAPDSATGPAARAVGFEHRRSAEAIAERRRGDVGVDRAAGGGETSGQQGRQDRTGRRGYQRRGECGADSGPDAVRRGGARSSGRGDRRHRPVGRGGHGERADQLPVAARSAADGVDRRSVELPRAGLGVRWSAGGRAARCGRADGDPGLDGGPALHHLQHRCVEPRAQPQHRDGPRPGDRLHAC